MVKLGIFSLILTCPKIKLIIRSQRGQKMLHYDVTPEKNDMGLQKNTHQNVNVSEKTVHI